MKKIIVWLTLSFLFFVLTSCDQLPINQLPTNYKMATKIQVTYQTIYGTAPDSISYSIGEGEVRTYTDEMLPTLEDHPLPAGRAVFSGWQKNGTEVKVGDPIGSNDVLNAIWKAAIGYEGEITYTLGQQLTPVPDSFIKVFQNSETATFGNAGTRIPTLLVLPNGDLLAFADYRSGGDIDGNPNTKIEIWCKRSKTNGETWEEATRVTPKSTGLTSAYGDAGVVYDKTTGDILVLVVGKMGLFQGTPENSSHIYVVRSKDKGLTWEEPVDITNSILGKDCQDLVRKNWGAGFVASGNGTQLSSGRLMFSIAVRTTPQTLLNEKGQAKSGQTQNFALFSDDGGNTWQLSDNSPTANGPVGDSGLKGCGDEAKIVELSDGRLYMQIRPNNSPTWHRRISYSYDQGKTWTDAEIDTQLPSSASNGDLMYYTSTTAGWDKNRLLCAFDIAPYNGNNDMSKILGAGSNSNNSPGYPAFFISYDDGKTWTGRCWHQGISAYSSFNILKDGSIGVLVEHGTKWGGQGISFFRTNVEWITNGADTGPVRVATDAE